MTVAERPSAGPDREGRAAAPLSAFERGTVIAAGAGLSALCAGVMLTRHGAGEHGTRKLLRATARISMALFCAAFSAGSLDQLLHRRPTRWMVRNRRHLGLGFAASQAIHLAAIVRVFRVSEGPRSPVAPAAIAGGSIGIAAHGYVGVCDLDRLPQKKGRGSDGARRGEH
jgi:hypothetical protein